MFILILKTVEIISLCKELVFWILNNITQSIPLGILLELYPFIHERQCQSYHIIFSSYHNGRLFTIINERDKETKNLKHLVLQFFHTLIDMIVTKNNLYTK